MNIAQQLIEIIKRTPIYKQAVSQAQAEIDEKRAEQIRTKKLLEEDRLKRLPAQQAAIALVAALVFAAVFAVSLAWR